MIISSDLRCGNGAASQLEERPAVRPLTPSCTNPHTAPRTGETGTFRAQQRREAVQAVAVAPAVGLHTDLDHLNRIRQECGRGPGHYARGHLPEQVRLLGV